eukprot:CAMPEP_0119300958 /NCGR_PEP_ID=MMETSP1333-20130426/2835_1 /TAXON_ID=418940 /ORGANISM="Scyphosphaera apsteinii, Strain RCC1455" /LENGTH=40 /DNA_ID= /DNA_START= /DNA_END= /DNA_ORIENTATION=
MATRANVEYFAQDKLRDSFQLQLDEYRRLRFLRSWSINVN